MCVRACFSLSPLLLIGKGSNGRVATPKPTLFEFIVCSPFFLFSFIITIATNSLELQRIWSGNVLSFTHTHTYTHTYILTSPFQR